jgi:phage shock protein PspC (stress-responsive transcriptional regulator)
MAFRIEEDAYEKLQNYLDAVEKVLGSDDDAKETLEDIEVRMAELFIPVTRDNDVSITLKDVEEMIRILGKPEDYAPEEEIPPSASAGESKKTYTPPPPPIGRRLYRDPHSRVLGGVCSGLGAYFNVDPILFRLLFIIGLFYGISIIPYLILWIVMPKALTIEQRMHMYGGEQTFSKSKGAYGPIYGQSSSVNSIMKVMGVIIGIFLILVTFIAMVALAVGLFMSNLIPGLLPETFWSWQEFHQFILPVEESLPLLTGMALVIGIPLLMLFYLGLQLVFRFKRGSKVIGALGLILWLAGIALLVYGGLKTAVHFRETGVVEQTIELDEINSKTIYIKPVEMSGYTRVRRHERRKEYRLRRTDGGIVLESRPEIRVVKDASRLALVIEKEARGLNTDDAMLNAEKAEFFWLQKDSVLRLDRIFTLSRGAQFRNQKVIVRLEVPTGVNVQIDPEYRHAVRIY